MRSRATRGDLDCVRDVDLDDFGEFAGCIGGPDVTLPPRCEGANLDPDGDVDLEDAALFQTLFTGSR